MRLPLVLALVSGVLAASAAARASTIAVDAGGTSATPMSVYLGQSFTVDGTGSFDDISFNFQTGSGGAYALGTGFLYSEAYTGDPAALGSANPGLLGSAVAANGSYNFGSGVTLVGGQQYFFYENADLPTGSIEGGGSYSGGTVLYALSSTGDFAAEPVEANFSVDGTAVTAEPASLALFSTGLLGMLWIVDRRRA